MAAESSPRLAGVLVLTTMGRVLLQCERDAAVPFHVPKLALLLASLLQFATPRQDFARLQSKNGYCVVLSVDAAASVACAVIFRSGSALDERARLLSLVVLREFLARFQESVEHVVEQNHVDAEQMAEAYTLTRALDGETRSEDDDGGEGTMDMFLGFHDDVVMRLLEAPDALTPEGTNGKQGPVDVLHTNIVNAETGVLVTATHHRLEKTGEDAVAVVGSYACHQLVRRAARALQLAFPILYDTSLLQRRSNLTSHGQGLANASINATALVLRLTRAGPTSTNSYDVAIRMSHVSYWRMIYLTWTVPHRLTHTNCPLAAWCLCGQYPLHTQR
jgi:hypothetical protein